MASSSPKPNVLISFENDKHETAITTKLGKALGEVVATYEEVMTGKFPIPSTQTRLSFYGHGDVDKFGSDKVHFTPEEFAQLLIKILTINPNIKDIDLMACNVGLLDEKGECYTSK